MSENICSVCNEKFEDKYFDKEQNKCILHCEKEKNPKNFKYGLPTEYSNMKLDFSHILKKVISEYKESLDYMDGYPLELKNIIFPLNNISCLKDIEVRFEDSKFINDLVLSSKHFEYIEFFDCDFYSNFKISHNLGNYDKELILRNCNFYNNNNNVKVDLSSVNFKHFVDFRECVFFIEVDMMDSSFEDNVYFNKCKFHKSLNLEDTIFYKKVSFNQIDLKSGVQNRETARIIKHSFEQQNNIIEANKFYALEMKEREKELNWKKDFFDWIVFKAHGLASNHSQNWLLPIFWIIFLGLLNSYFQPLDFYTMSHVDFLYKELFIGLLVSLTTFVFLLSLIEHKIYYNYISSFFIILLVYLIFTNDIYFSDFANSVNPFSIMTKGEELSFGTLIYKITIAYLIYQLIISIRQNTRRK